MTWKPPLTNLIVPSRPRITSSIGIGADHRRRHAQLAALVVVRYDRRHVRHVAAIVFQIQAATADHPRRITHAHRRDHVRRLMHEQIGEHAAAERPVAAPLSEHGPVERHVLGRRPQRHALDHLKLVAEEHVPIDRLGIHLLVQAVIAPLADQRVAVIARLCLGDMADLALGDLLVRLATRLDRPSTARRRS